MVHQEAPLLELVEPLPPRGGLAGGRGEVPVVDGEERLPLGARPAPVPPLASRPPPAGGALGARAGPAGPGPAATAAPRRPLDETPRGLGGVAGGGGAGEAEEGGAFGGEGVGRGRSGRTDGGASGRTEGGASGRTEGGAGGGAEGGTSGRKEGGAGGGTGRPVDSPRAARCPSICRPKGSCGLPISTATRTAPARDPRSATEPAAPSPEPSAAPGGSRPGGVGPPTPSGRDGAAGGADDGVVARPSHRVVPAAASGGR